MRIYGFVALAIAVVYVASCPTGAYAVKSAKGNEFTWDAGYPKCTNLGTEPPTIAVNYGVTPADGWTPDKIEFKIFRYDDIQGLMYNGEELKTITANFSAEHTYNVPLTGKSVRIKHNGVFLSRTNPVDTDAFQEADKGPIQIRN